MIGFEFTAMVDRQSNEQHIKRAAHLRSLAMVYESAARFNLRLSQEERRELVAHACAFRDMARDIDDLIAQRRASEQL